MWPPSSVEVKQYLKIASDNILDDDLIAMSRHAAKDRVERYCQRRFLTATRTYYLNGDGTALLPIPDWPISSVTSVVENGSAPRDWTGDAVNTDYYQVMNNSSTMDDEGKRSIQRISGAWPMGAQNIQVMAVTGYVATEIPDDLLFATIELAGHIYMRADNKRIGVTSRTEQGGSTQLDMERAAIPLAIRDALDPFRAAGSFGY
jgi:hypothetical protein